MKNYWNESAKTMHMHDTTAKGFPFCLEIVHEDNALTVRHVGLTYPAHTLPTGQIVGSVHMGFRVKCWGDIYHRLTRGIEIPSNWYSHNEA